MTEPELLAALAIGVAASVLMDLWNLLLRLLFGIPSLNYCLLGRWVIHLLGGTFLHADIRLTPQRPDECAVGWTAHYGIGGVFALCFLGLVSGDWLAAPTAFPALVFGLVTVVFPMFVLQPAIGLGIAASRTPKPWTARLKSLATHTVFGLGLYGWAVVLTRIG